MKCFKKRGLWVLFGVMVLVGAFFVVDVGSKNQPPIILNTEIRDESSYTFPGDTIYIPRQGSGSHLGVFSHPSDTIYISRGVTFPGDTIYYHMPNVGTISTASTCAWDCGPTYTTCAATCNRSAQGRTLMTCGGSLIGNCGGGNTSFTCSGTLFGGCGGVIPTFTTCSSGIYCKGSHPTSNTCGIFCTGESNPTLFTCTGAIFCRSGGNNTFITCNGGFIGGCGGGGITNISCGPDLIWCGGTTSGTGYNCTYYLRNSGLSQSPAY